MRPRIDPKGTTQSALVVRTVSSLLRLCASPVLSFPGRPQTRKPFSRRGAETQRRTTPLHPTQKGGAATRKYPSRPCRAHRSCPSLRLCVSARDALLPAPTSALNRAGPGGKTVGASTSERHVGLRFALRTSGRAGAPRRVPPGGGRPWYGSSAHMDRSWGTESGRG